MLSIWHLFVHLTTLHKYDIILLLVFKYFYLLYKRSSIMESRENLQKRQFFTYIRKNILEVERKKLAEALSVSETTIINIENGKLPVSKNIFLALYVLLQQYKEDFYLYYGNKARMLDNVINILKNKYIQVDYIKLF